MRRSHKRGLLETILLPLFLLRPYRCEDAETIVVAAEPSFARMPMMVRASTLLPVTDQRLIGQLQIRRAAEVAVIRRLAALAGGQ